MGAVHRALANTSQMQNHTFIAPFIQPSLCPPQTRSGNAYVAVSIHAMCVLLWMKCTTDVASDLITVSCLSAH